MIHQKMKPVFIILCQVLLLKQVWTLTLPGPTCANGIVPNLGASFPGALNTALPNVLATGVPLAAGPVISNAHVTPILSEIVPSLQYGDITLAGDMPIGGTIKVSGCFPVYGMVAVDGNVPSAGTAYVSESFGNQVLDVVGKCARQILS